MRFLKGFYYAGRGVAYAFRERNFRFHICAAAAVIYFGLRFYSFSKAEWAILLLTCAAVLSLEAVNTALERLADKVSAERSELVGKCKDCAAGAVLICAIFAAVIGVIMFWDADRFSLILAHFSEPWRLILLVAAILIMWCFVFLFPNGKNGRRNK